jgi:hypothetical protein
VVARPSERTPAPSSSKKPPQRPRFVRALLPNPELWTASLRHRTQICQDLDQAMVVFMLGLKPGGFGRGIGVIDFVWCMVG